MRLRHLVFAFVALLAQGAFAQTTQPSTQFGSFTYVRPVDANGWSIPAPRANQLYVDPVAGNDANAGATVDKPLKTIAKARTIIKPDTQLNLKRGTTFNESLGWWSYPHTTVTAYGAGARPHFIVAPQNGPLIHVFANDVEILHIDGEQQNHNPALPGYDTAHGATNGISQGGDDLLIEDCRLQFFFQQISIGGTSKNGVALPLHNVTIRRNVIKDAHSASGFAQGLYCDFITNLVVEENLFDRNGGYYDANGKPVGTPNGFIHNIYSDNDVQNYPTLYKNNIIVRGYGGGLQQRAGGTADGNLFWDNGPDGTTFFCGGTTSYMVNNVVTSSATSTVGQSMQGADFQAANGQILNNLFVHCKNQFGLMQLSSIRHGVVFTNPTSVTISGNLTYDSNGDGIVLWDQRTNTTITNNSILQNVRKAINARFSFLAGTKFVGNHYTLSGNGKQFYVNGPAYDFPGFVKLSKDTGDQVAPKMDDPSRTIEKYAASIGLAGTSDSLLAALFNQSADSWDTRLTAGAINSWIRAGFTHVEVPPAPPGQLKGTTIGTAGSWSGKGNTIAKAFDGDPNTFFDAPTADGGWVGLDLGAPAQISSVFIVPRHDWSGFMARSVGAQVQIATQPDFSDARTVLTVPTITNGGTTFNVSGTGRYVRYVGPKGSYCNVAEFQVTGIPAAAPPVTQPTTSVSFGLNPGGTGNDPQGRPANAIEASIPPFDVVVASAKAFNANYLRWWTTCAITKAPPANMWVQSQKYAAAGFKNIAVINFTNMGPVGSPLRGKVPTDAQWLAFINGIPPATQTGVWAFEIGNEFDFKDYFTDTYANYGHALELAGPILRQKGYKVAAANVLFSLAPYQQLAAAGKLKFVDFIGAHWLDSSAAVALSKYDALIKLAADNGVGVLCTETDLHTSNLATRAAETQKLYAGLKTRPGIFLYFCLYPVQSEGGRGSMLDAAGNRTPFWDAVMAGKN